MVNRLSVQQLHRFGVIAACMVSFIGALDSADAALEGVKDITPEGKAGWATALPDGRLMMWWTEGKQMGNAKSVSNPNIVQKAFARYSVDNGYTWSDPQLLFEFPKSKGIYTAKPTLCDKDGVIHLFGLHYFYFDREKYGGKSLVYHVMSSDGGKTWTKPQYCDFGHQYTGAIMSVLQLRSGRILVPLAYCSEKIRGSWPTVMTLSDDGGRTWRPSREEIPLVKPSESEASCLELKDGRVWALIRTSTGVLYQSFSSDGGDTWTAMQPTQFASTVAPAALLRLHDGRIVLVWNNCGPGKGTYDRQVLAAAISDDDGRSWRGYREIARMNRDRNGGIRRVMYAWLTEAKDGAVVVSYSIEFARGDWHPAVSRLDPEWLTETRFRDDFSEGLANWMTIGVEGGVHGAVAVAHPDRPGRRVLALPNPEADGPAGASLNFPFGVRGHLTVKVRLQPGFSGARLSLTDCFWWPREKEDGRFGIDISPKGELSVVTAPDKLEATGAVLQPGKWHTLGFTWDCKRGTCDLAVNYRTVARLPQLSAAPGICYLRLWAPEGAQKPELLVESVSAAVETP